MNLADYQNGIELKNWCGKTGKLLSKVKPFFNPWIEKTCKIRPPLTFKVDSIEKSSHLVSDIILAYSVRPNFGFSFLLPIHQDIYIFDRIKNSIRSEDMEYVWSWGYESTPIGDNKTTLHVPQDIYVFGKMYLLGQTIKVT